MEQVYRGLQRDKAHVEDAWILGLKIILYLVTLSI